MKPVRSWGAWSLVGSSSPQSTEIRWGGKVLMYHRVVQPLLPALNQIASVEDTLYNPTVYEEGLLERMST